MDFAIKCLLSCFVALTLFSFLSVPLVDEKCVACGQRECPVGISKPLRKLSIIEWYLDSTGDLHLNVYCPNKFIADNIKRGVK